jgi:hypothetical protein
MESTEALEEASELPARAVPGCLICGAKTHVRMVHEEDGFEVFVCQNPASPVGSNGPAVSEDGKFPCRTTVFVLSQGGGRHVSYRAALDVVIPPIEHLARSAVANAKRESGIALAEKRLRDSRRTCPNQSCAEFRVHSRKPFCGRCGGATVVMAEVVTVQLKSAKCAAEGCAALGKQALPNPYETFCPDCGTKYTEDLSRANVAAGKEEA